MYHLTHTLKQIEALILTLWITLFCVVNCELKPRTGDSLYTGKSNEGSEIESFQFDKTYDQSPGIGFEFESSNIKFRSMETTTDNIEETYKLKGHLINDREQANWKLTGDTIKNKPGVLLTEYILNGKTIKLGEDQAVEAAEEVTRDMESLLRTARLMEKVTVKDSTHKDWQAELHSAINPASATPETLRWNIQVTAPMPLEAIYDLFSKAAHERSSHLLPQNDPFRGMVYVTKQFWRTKPNGISPDKVTEDIMGFFCLVLSYAKLAQKLPPDESMKSRISIMPRTDFRTIYKHIKHKLQGRLYDIITILACYKNQKIKVGEETRFGIAMDDNFCEGTVDDPKPTEKLDHMRFEGSSSNGKRDSFTVEEWVQSIEEGKGADLLTKLDHKTADSSIGGLRTRVEFGYQSERLIPIFEFRRIARIQTSELPLYVDTAEQEVIEHHERPIYLELQKRAESLKSRSRYRKSRKDIHYLSV